MRRFTMIAAAMLVAELPGCALMIHHSGITVHDPDSRDGVQKQFGTPDSVTQSQRIDPDTDELRTFDVENYHVHAKFDTAMPTGAGGLGLLLDPFLTFQELYKAGKEYVQGHDLAFVYDEHGQTIGYQHPQPFLQRLQSRDENNVLYWQSPADPE